MDQITQPAVPGVPQQPGSMHNDYPAAMNGPKDTGLSHLANRSSHCSFSTYTVRSSAGRVGRGCVRAFGLTHYPKSAGCNKRQERNRGQRVSLIVPPLVRLARKFNMTGGQVLAWYTASIVTVLLILAIIEVIQAAGD